MRRFTSEFSTDVTSTCVDMLLFFFKVDQQAASSSGRSLVASFESTDPAFINKKRGSPQQNRGRESRGREEGRPWGSIRE